MKKNRDVCGGAKRLIFEGPFLPRSRGRFRGRDVESKELFSCSPCRWRSSPSLSSIERNEQRDFCMLPHWRDLVKTKFFDWCSEATLVLTHCCGQRKPWPGGCAEWLQRPCSTVERTTSGI